MLEPSYYEFEGFCVDPQKRLLLRTGEPIEITDRAFDTLVLLLENNGHIVERERFFREVWQDAAVEPNNLDQSIYALRNALGDTKEPRQYIKSVPRRGFIFLKKVERTMGPHAGLSEPRIAPPSSEQVSQPASPIKTEAPEVIGEHQSHSYLGHLMASCGLYALLYTVALLLEVAYKFDLFAPVAIELAALIFFFVFAASLGGLWLEQKRTLEGKSGGLALCSLLFVVTGLLVYGLLGFFLPGSAITEANFQTYPARAAYLKDVSYFLALAFLFMIVPFHFVLSVEREIRAGKHRSALDLLMGKQRGIAPGGAVFLRPSWLVILLIIAVAGSQIAMAHLIENLRPSGHMYLFTALMEARRLNYFVLGIECLVWYYRALNDLKKECLNAMRPHKGLAASRT